MTLRPLIAICGTTGVGKSKLAIEIASFLSRATSAPASRIINADAMQVYAGMDIITNKIPVTERQGIEHLLMGFKQPGEQYVVGEWVHDAVHAIDETHRKNCVPIVVGGTSYWIQHLLFLNSLPASKSELNPPPQPPQSPPISSSALENSLQLLPDDLRYLFLNLPVVPPIASIDPDAAFALHNLLSRLDPTTAARWHWRDTRKVLRSLNIISEHKRTATDVVTSMNSSSSASRYRTLVFWLYADSDALNPRLDLRVDEMVEQGLLQEIRSFNNPASSGSVEVDAPDSPNPELSSQKNKTDYTLGIYQSIGFKEFHAYLSSPDPSPTLFTQGLVDMKHNTRKYAQRQIKWIRNKLLPAAQAANSKSRGECGSDVVSTYLLDATVLDDQWDINVRDKAFQITRDFLDQNPLPDPQSLSETAHRMLIVPDKPTQPAETLAARRKLVCPVCTLEPSRPVMIEEGRDWEAHQRTKTHRGIARRRAKAEVSKMDDPDWPGFRPPKSHGQENSMQDHIDSHISAISESNIFTDQ
ncbi:tRNA isopentenyltransferase [Rickenella mellea]|uniref:tRNA isopentenyltransferase n=1 Tax=Rickenella mellea TaxID=50990 RepID=A0A4Y7PYJ6_9AGAM|nr:tRNA isopentenyltransferase [Rickenella mellea]